MHASHTHAPRTRTLWLRPTLSPSAKAAVFPLPLHGTDLVFWGIPLMLILCGPLDERRATEALVETLDYYSHAVSRFRNEGGKLELVEGAKGIPLTFAETSEAYDHYTSQGEAPAHLFDALAPDGDGDDPLLRIRATYCPATQETYVGLNFSHVLGDGEFVYQFLHAWSQHYQGLPPTFAPPTWEKYRSAPPDEDAAAFVERCLPHLRRLYPRDEFLRMAGEVVQASERVDVLFTRAQIGELHRIASAWPGRAGAGAGAGRISTQDALAAYVIAVYNQCLEVPITRASNILSYRNVPNPPNLGPTDWRAPGASAVGNAIFQAFTAPFARGDARSLGAVAWGIRKSITDARNYEHLKRVVAVSNPIWRRMMEEGKEHRFWQEEGGVVVNCFGKLSFPSCHFGYGATRTRFLLYEAFSGYIRFFAAAPVKLADGAWQANEGALWMLLRVSRGIRDKFLATIAQELNSPAFPGNLEERERRVWLEREGERAKL